MIVADWGVLLSWWRCHEDGSSWWRCSWLLELSLFVWYYWSQPIEVLLSWLNPCCLREFATTQEVLLTSEVLKWLRNITTIT
jgi:hypothetical protein